MNSENTFLMSRHFKIKGVDKDTKLNIRVTNAFGDSYDVIEKGDMSLSDTFRSEFKNYLESKGANTSKMDWEKMNIAFTGDTMKGYFDYIKEKYG